jgi:ligand-binding sensor domain-containing protein
VLSFHVEQNRFYFFGITDIGVLIYDNALKKTHRINALASLDIYSILKDEKGNFWIGTSNGLAMIKGNDLFLQEENKIEVNTKCKVRFLRKNLSDPFNSIQSNHVFTLAQDHNDRIWVGTGQGLSSIDINTKKSRMSF